MILSLPPAGWPTAAYAVVLADPPWYYYGDPSKDQAAGKHYAMMTLEELLALPVPQLLRKPSVLFMWATSPKLDVTLALGTGWGLHYRGIASCWVKTTQDGKVINGQGVRPSIVKPTTEYLLKFEHEEEIEQEVLLAFSTKKTGRPLPLLTEAMPQVVFAPRPAGQHSAKPPIFRENIDRLYGEIPRVEMFCRGPSGPGWDNWGNEATL